MRIKGGVIVDLQEENVRFKKALDDAVAEIARVRRIAESRDAHMVYVSGQIGQLQKENAGLKLQSVNEHIETVKAELTRRILSDDIPKLHRVAGRTRS